ncbi:MAG: ATP-binding protein, partial [Bacteroidota bacterium]
HEIMNSITPISSLAETLAYQLKLNLDSPKDHKLEIEDLFDGVTTIKNRSEGLLKFAKTYRSLSKVTHLNLQKIKVSELFNNIKLLLEPSLNAKGIDISFKTDSKRMELDIDTHLIEQVLINLILNARDALQDREQPIIQVKAVYGTDRNIKIKVYDNGAGIPKSLMENIFIPFFTSKSTGSGIGLSLCKQIMLLHKGKILVLSKENEGTVFTLVF